MILFHIVLCYLLCTQAFDCLQCWGVHLKTKNHNILKKIMYEPTIQNLLHQHERHPRAVKPSSLWQPRHTGTERETYTYHVVSCRSAVKRKQRCTGKCKSEKQRVQLTNKQRVVWAHANYHYIVYHDTPTDVTRFLNSNNRASVISPAFLTNWKAWFAAAHQRAPH